MVEFPKYVKINDLDLVMAIREGMNPMLEWYDKKHNNLPYFQMCIRDRHCSTEIDTTPGVGFGANPWLIEFSKKG